MKKLPTGKKMRGSGESWHKHLRPDGKRRANKGTRKALKIPTSPKELNVIAEQMVNAPTSSGAEQRKKEYIAAFYDKKPRAR